MWLLQDGSEAKKHQEWFHPCIVYLIHYSVVALTVFGAHDLVIGSSADCERDTSIEYQQYRRRQVTCAIGTGIYAILQLSCRLWQASSHRTSVLYEGTWLCNTTLVIGSLAFWYRRPVIAAAFCVTVGIDQLLWYVDLLTWFLSGRFAVGVAKYLSWPSTTWWTRLTCTHHLWTLPLFLGYAAAPLPYHALLLSSLLMILHVSLSRMLTPFHVQDKYLNVNLSHELWKDISMKGLQISEDNPPAHVYLYRLLLKWEGFNVIVYAVLLLMQRLLPVVHDGNPLFC
jgi:hypothetical protein